MKYKMTVSITDPKATPGMVGELHFKLYCDFYHDSEDYGNGHYLYISGSNFSEKIYDLRYDTTFHRDEKRKYLEEWAKNHWPGEHGAWLLKSVSIDKY